MIPIADLVRGNMWDLIENRLWADLFTAKYNGIPEDQWEAIDRRFDDFDPMNLWVRLWERMAENIERQVSQ